MTEEDLEKMRTAKGGFTKEALEALGVSWPPPKGWKKSLLTEPSKSFTEVIDDE